MSGEWLSREWLSGMMGLVVGDALGNPVQFMPREKIRNRINGDFTGPVQGMEYGGVFNTPIGTWTDDSSMAIATLASILEFGSPIPEEVMKNFVKWNDKGYFTPFGRAFDQGLTCCEAIERYKNTSDAKTCGLVDVRSNGNGSLMRILPVCLYYYHKQCDTDINITDEAIEGIDAISGLTHNHLRSRIACGLYYFMVKSILSNRNGNSLQECLQRGIDEGRAYYDATLFNLSEILEYRRVFDLLSFSKLGEDAIESSGYVVDSLEAAIWCLIVTDDYKECMLRAVNLGKDTDTIAAIAGGIAGLYYGYDGIPAEWVKVIQKKEWLENMFTEADRLFDIR